MALVRWATRFPKCWKAGKGRRFGGGPGTLGYTLSGLALITLAGLLLVGRKCRFNK